MTSTTTRYRKTRPTKTCTGVWNTVKTTDDLWSVKTNEIFYKQWNYLNRHNTKTTIQNFYCTNKQCPIVADPIPPRHHIIGSPRHCITTYPRHCITTYPRNCISTSLYQHGTVSSLFMHPRHYTTLQRFHVTASPLWLTRQCRTLVHSKVLDSSWTSSVFVQLWRKIMFRHSSSHSFKAYTLNLYNKAYICTL